jgi:SSS family solute:Na+ symporter
MVASLLAAFMSTMDTQLNWGASYLVNDLYKRFINPNASEERYVFVSRIAMLLLVVLAAFAAWQSQSVTGAWKYLVTLTAGVGFVGLLRWYWWRVSAWSEIAGLTSSVIIANGGLWLGWLHNAGLVSDTLHEDIAWLYGSEAFAPRLVFIIGTCTAIWITVTFLTRPHRDDHLNDFYRRVRPGGWWGAVAQANPDIPRESMAKNWIGWLLGVVCIYSGLFGVGYVFLAAPAKGVAFLALSAVCGWGMLKSVPAHHAETETR